MAVGQRVKKGEIVGELVDLVGEPLATVTAPAGGLLLLFVSSPAIKKVGLLLAIGALDRFQRWPTSPAS